MIFSHCAEAEAGSTGNYKVIGLLARVSPTPHDSASGFHQQRCDHGAALARRSLPEPGPEPEARAGPGFRTVEGNGFSPGEDVPGAVVTGHTDAAHTGTARALIDRAGVSIDQAGGVVEVSLFGRVSGTTISRRVP